MKRVDGSGNKLTENRPVSGFDSVELYGIGKLTLRQDGTESLSIEGDDNIVPLVRADVQGSTLRIGLEDHIQIDPRTPLRFNATARVINALVLSGAGAIEGDDITADTFEGRISGAGDLHLGNLTAKNLNITLSGAGQVTASGNVSTQDVRISGAGSYHATDLQSRNATVNASGAGSAAVRVSDNLSANLTGVGSIRYYGNPRVEKRNSGIGSITKAGD